MPEPSTDRVEKGLPQQRELSQVELPVLYRQYHDEYGTKATRLGIWSSFFVYILFSATDILLVPDVAAYTVIARFTFGVVMLSIFELLFRWNAGSAWLDRLCAAAVFLGYLSWLVPSMMTEHTVSMSYYMVFGAIFMMGANLFFSFQFRLSVITSSLVFSVFLLAMMVLYPYDTPYQIAFGTFYLSCFVFTSYVNWKLNQERYNVFLNALEAKSSTRKLRNEDKRCCICREPIRLRASKTAGRSTRSCGTTGVTGKGLARVLWPCLSMWTSSKDSTTSTDTRKATTA
jgi:hypothetical protein